jgi:hypothetical protein
MNIDWIIPCRYVEVHDNLATIIGGGIDTFWVEELPSTIQLLLAIRLTGLSEEFTPDHSTATRIKDPSGNTISEMKGEFAIGAESERSDFQAGVTLPAQSSSRSRRKGPTRSSASSTTPGSRSRSTSSSARPARRSG